MVTCGRCARGVLPPSRCPQLSATEYVQPPAHILTTFYILHAPCHAALSLSIYPLVTHVSLRTHPISFMLPTLSKYPVVTRVRYVHINRTHSELTCPGNECGCDWHMDGDFTPEYAPSAFSRLLAPSHACSRLLTPSQCLLTPSHAFSRLLTPSHAFSPPISCAAVSARPSYG